MILSFAKKNVKSIVRVRLTCMTSSNSHISDLVGSVAKRITKFLKPSNIFNDVLGLFTHKRLIKQRTSFIESCNAALPDPSGGRQKGGGWGADPALTCPEGQDSCPGLPVVQEKCSWSIVDRARLSWRTGRPGQRLPSCPPLQVQTEHEPGNHRAAWSPTRAESEGSLLLRDPTPSLAIFNAPTWVTCPRYWARQFSNPV